MNTNQLLLSLALSLSVAACQGNDSDTGGDETGGEQGPTVNDPCGACPPGGYAVDCGYLWGIGEFTVCGINQDNAEYLCDSTWAGVIKSSPSDECAVTNEPWDPSLDILRDPAGEFTAIIGSRLLDRLERHPQDIYLDRTRIDWDDGGEVVVSTAGELSSALGLEQGDILIDVNGYLLVELLDTARLYFTLRGASVLELRIERNGKHLILNYRIE